MGQATAVNEILVGSICVEEVVAENGRVLVERGDELTVELIDSLLERGQDFVRVEPPRVGRGRKKQRSESEPPVPAGHGLAGRRQDRSRDTYDTERQERFSQTVDRAIQQIANLAAQPEKIQDADLSSTCGVMAEMVVEDSDQSLDSINFGTQTELSNRCAQLCLLSMSVAIELKYSDDDVKLLGIAGMIHDLGLLTMPKRLRDPTITLSFDEMAEYLQHPLITDELVKNCLSVPTEARILALQVHELPDGSGYPKGLPAFRHHRLTKILNVVDVYLSLVQAGAGRPAMIPHDAIAFILYNCQAELFDPKIVRALINQMSLYGIGGRVKLESGTEAKIVRRDSDHYDQPVVAVEGRPNFLMLSESDDNIDSLLHCPDTEMRFTRDLFESVPLNSLVRASFE